MTFLLSTPPNFSLDTLCTRSRLSSLPPLRYDAAARALTVALPALEDGGEALALRLTQAAAGAALEVRGVGRAGSGAGPERLRAAVEALLRDMLRLDEDLSLFYALTDRDAELSFARGAGAGFVLRSPTAFEDLVKCLLLGRAASRATELCAALCARLGRPTAEAGLCAFPDAATLAQQPLALLQELGLGPLAPRLLELAQRCAAGPLSPESLRRGPLSRVIPQPLTDDELDALIEQETEWEDRMVNLLLDLPGFGERSTCLMLPLLGCYDALALLDQVLLAWVKQRPGRARPPRPKEVAERPVWRLRLSRQILRRVEPFAHYRALALQLLLQGG